MGRFGLIVSLVMTATNQTETTETSPRVTYYTTGTKKTLFVKVTRFQDCAASAEFFDGEETKTLFFNPGEGSTLTEWTSTWTPASAEAIAKFENR